MPFLAECVAACCRVCCSMLQSVLQCVAECVAACRGVLQERRLMPFSAWIPVNMYVRDMTHSYV